MSAAARAAAPPAPDGLAGVTGPPTLVHTYHTRKGNTYVIKCGFSTHYRTRVYWLEGQRDRSRDQQSGAQDHMLAHAKAERHTTLVAFDDPLRRKLFASYSSTEECFRALIDPAQRWRPTSVPLMAYEIVAPDRPCWPHFDVEWKPGGEHTFEPLPVLLALMDEIVRAFRALWPFHCTNLTVRDFRVARAANMCNKVSYHLVLRGGVIFANNVRHHNAFVQYLFSTLVRRMVLEGESALRQYFFDRSKLKKVIGGGWVVDDRIYTSYRQFRLLGSQKQGAPERVLLPYDPFNDRVLATTDQFTVDMWRQYLLCDVQPADEQRSALGTLTCSDKVLALLGRSVPTHVRSPELNTLGVYFAAHQLDEVNRAALIARDDSVDGGDGNRAASAASAAAAAAAGARKRSAATASTTSLSAFASPLLKQRSLGAASNDDSCFSRGSNNSNSNSNSCSSGVFSQSTSDSLDAMDDDVRVAAFQLMAALGAVT